MDNEEKEFFQFMLNLSTFFEVIEESKTGLRLRDTELVQT